MANIIIRTFISLLIIFGAYKLAEKIISTKKVPESRQAPAIIPQVNVLEVTKANYRPGVKSFGNVQSYFQTTLTPEVSGKIVTVSPRFRVGQEVTEGEILATIDETDYIASLATQKANLILQERTLAEEEIRAKQAAADWEASGRNLDTASDFVLRKPQLAAARANIDSVKATILKAEADLQRTKIKAPYDAIVTQRNASIGNFASAQSSLGTLVATEKAEVRIPLTAVQMARVQFNQQVGKQPVLTLTSPSNTQVTWQAILTQIEPTVNPQNQVSYVIATVNKPYESAQNPLSVGSFVNVLLPSREIIGAYKIPESALVSDSYLWVVDENDELVRVEAQRIQSDESFAYIKITYEKPIIRLITRPLSTFRSGMKVRWREDKPEKEAKQS